MRNLRVDIVRIILTGLFASQFIVCYGGDLKVNIVPDHNDWIYNIGENVTFKVSISGDTPGQFSVSYEIGPEKMTAWKEDSFNSSNKEFIIDGGTMKVPGFLRCTITISFGDITQEEYATAAFQPWEIVPTTEYPKDFLSFWEKSISKARKIPLDTQLTLIKDKCTDTYNVYQVSYLNDEYKNRSYGILTIPVKSGKFPAVIRFPGAGVHPSGGNLAIADKNIITIDLYIHPFPVLWEKKFYDNLRESPYIDYKFWGAYNRDAYYFRRVISGCVKAVDVIFSLSQFDGKNLASWGSSQGGALSIITTSLDKRINMLVALCPAMCDFTGYLHGRAGGWPHFFNQENMEKYNTQDVLNTVPYYDVVNFARNITVPGFYSWGFNDETTPPTSIYAAYNVIKASKQVFIIPEGKHRIYPEQPKKTNQWILDSFQK
ncbi:acetylxylan esterase [Proteiniphilum sp.]|uniref:acetylxylan esterase n=1 Tax=Proteiniphilum sp. TaxID=1926877 RepID=UPI0033333523